MLLNMLGKADKNVTSFFTLQLQTSFYSTLQKSQTPGLSAPVVLEFRCTNLCFTVHKTKLNYAAFLMPSTAVTQCKFRKELIKSRTNVTTRGRSITFHDTVIWWLPPVVHSCSRRIKEKMSPWHSVAEMTLLKRLRCAINICKESFKRILSRLIDLRLHQLPTFGFLHNSASA